MNRDNTDWGPTPAASLAWTDKGEPYSPAFQDFYYSSENGLAESRHVFLAGNDLPARWQGRAAEFCIAETGFGSGLNFLLTWQAWRENAGSGQRLHFISIEKYPLDAQQLAKALQAWPELSELADALLDMWPGRLPGQHRISLDSGKVVLDLWWEDAAAALTDLCAHGPLVDAWYLDGFAPARNASMWQPEIFTSMAQLSRPGATLATYTAASAVRRGLEGAGFSLRKVPGYGHKRESLTGILLTPQQGTSFTTTPWDLDAADRGHPKSAIVIGGGLAGASMARALAQRGILVTLLDRNGIAGEASGNEQGVLYTRLSKRHSALTDFALQSFRYSGHYYHQLFAEGRLRPEQDGSLYGCFHQHSDEEELSIMRERLQELADIASVLDREEAGRRLGVQPAQAGYWYPDSGWLSPPAVCHALLDTPGVSVMTQCGQLSLRRDDGSWHATDSEGNGIATADIAVVCTGTGANAINGLEWLPIQAIRGQTTRLPANKASGDLQAAFCHQGYISPPVGGEHCIGASFKLHDRDTALRTAEHRENLDKLLTALPQWRQAFAELDLDTLQGRVAFRCASPDYLPIAGPVPDRDLFLQTYGALRKNARKLIDQRGNYVPGLYVNVAHGSRGLTSAPLCAQVLASQICGEAPPLSRELLRALSPARFLVRDLSRNRI